MPVAARTVRSLATWSLHDITVPVGVGNSARMLADLAGHGRPLTHDLLDTFPRGQARSQLRQALIHAGVLPVRQELIEDVEAWAGPPQ